MTTKPKASKFRVRRDRPGALRNLAGPEASDDAAAQGVDPTAKAAGSGDLRGEDLRSQIRALTDADTPPSAAEPDEADARTKRQIRTGATIARLTTVRNDPEDKSTPPTPPATSGAGADTGREATGRQETGREDTVREDTVREDTVREGAVSSAAQVAGETDMDAIRQEGLTGRQLRMARRMAQKHGLAVTSDFDAVRQLRQRGIDPFQRSNMLELVVPGKPDAGDGEKVQLPQTVPSPDRNLPSTEQASPMQRRMREIGEIQKDISRRRRRKSFLLLMRLMFFVGLPTLACGWYFYNVATPMYATKSEFLIIANDGAGTGMSGLLSGTQFATNQDAIAVQSYLQSKDAMLRLDQDVGFRAHFTQPWIDPIQRLSENPSNEEAYKLFKKNIEIGYDPTEGVIRMEVVAADPAVSAQYSKALIKYAEQRVDSLSSRKRDDQLEGAKTALDEAEKARRDAQFRLVELQQVSKVLDPEGRIASLRQQITNIEVQIQERELQLQALLDNARPNQAKVDGARGDIRRMNAVLERLQADMTDAAEGEDSLAKLSAEIQMAQADLATRDMMLQESLAALSATRREANSQVRYLQTAVEPVPSQDATYPRKFENTILAFLIFGGIYLLISLTTSILREQVSN